MTLNTKTNDEITSVEITSRADANIIIAGRSKISPTSISRMLISHIGRRYLSTLYDAFFPVLLIAMKDAATTGER